MRTLRQLGVFCLRLPENRDVGVSVIPEREEILVGSLRLVLISGQSERSAGLQMSRDRARIRPRAESTGGGHTSPLTDLIGS
jgi:hypothetical protein